MSFPIPTFSGSPISSFERANSPLTLHNHALNLSTLKNTPQADNIPPAVQAETSSVVDEEAHTHAYLSYHKKPPSEPHAHV